MKILIISKYFYPENTPRAFRTTELALELAARGNKIVIYSDHILTTESMNFFKQKKISIRKLDRSTKQTTQLNLISKLIAVLSKKLFEYPDIKYLPSTLKLLKKEKDFDGLITIAAPHTIHWGAAIGRAVLTKFPRRWVADCGDPYMGNPINKPLFYFKIFENFFLKKADIITIPIEKARNAYPSKIQHKIKVIPQGFNFDEVPKSFKKNSKSKIIFVYAGSIYSNHRNPTKFLDFLVTLKLNFIFIVYTNNVEFFSKWKSKLGPKIVIKAFISRLELLKKIAEVDFVINFENNSTEQLPSKLIDYALVGKPILSVNTSNLDKNSILRFLQGDYQDKMVIANLEQYNIKNIAKQFEELLEC